MESQYLRRTAAVVRASIAIYAGLRPFQPGSPDASRCAHGCRHRSACEILHRRMTPGLLRLAVPAGTEKNRHIQCGNQNFLMDSSSYEPESRFALRGIDGFDPNIDCIAWAELCAGREFRSQVVVLQFDISFLIQNYSGKRLL